jgi:hypothetical protein
MDNAQKRVQWVIHFIGQDLHHFRQGDWLNLRDDMWLFLRGLPLGQYEELRRVPFTAEETQQFTPESFAAVQQSARDMLQRIAKTNARVQYKPPEGRVMSEEVAGKIDKVYFDFSRPGPLRLYVLAEHLSDAFRFALGAALSAVDITDIRECLSPACRTIFFAGHGRQRFCSSTCKTREGSRRFRERYGEELKEKAHTYYERKVRAKLGAGVRINKNKKSKRSKEG